MKATVLAAPVKVTTVGLEDRPQTVWNTPQQVPARTVPAGLAQLPVTGASVWTLTSVALLLMGTGGWLLLRQRRDEGDSTV